VVLCAVGWLVVPAAVARPDPPARPDPFPPFPAISAVPAVPAVPQTPTVLPGFGDDPPPKPTTSTSLQQPRELPPPPGTGPAARSPLEAEAENRLPTGSVVTLPDAPAQLIRFGPRYGELNTVKGEKIPGTKDGQRITYLGGLTVNIVTREAGGPREVELAGDNVVIWVEGVNSDFNLTQQLQVDKPKPAGEDPKEGEKKRVKVEIYLCGNVVIRTRSQNAVQGVMEQALRADEIYYDAETSRAIAVRADLETKFVTGYDSLHLRSAELWQLGKNEFRAFDALTFSSKRPADPALTFNAREATLIQENVVRRNVFGRPYRNTRTGEPDVGLERTLTAADSTVRVLGVPVAYFRNTTLDLNDPAGPLVGLGFRSDRVYGQFQMYTTWDLFDLLGVRGAAGNQWLLNLDYLSLRGPGVGTDFIYRDLFGSVYRNTGNVSWYLMYDAGRQDPNRADLLGGFRGPEPEPPYYRGRFVWTHNQDLFEKGVSFTRFTGQFAYLSDKNFYEQFYKLRYDSDPNQETFAYLYGAVGNVAWSGLVQANVNRPWVTETSWLPRLDAAVVGESFFDSLVYTARLNAGVAKFRPAIQEPLSHQPSEQAAVDTLKAGVYQRLSLPFDAGPVRLEPYGVLDLSAYSRDQSGDGTGRVYGGGGLQASVPFSKLYREVESDLLNVRGLYHKVELRANYFIAGTDTDPRTLPLLDRLDDDASDLSFRTWRRYGGLFTAPGTNGMFLRDTPRGQALATAPFFDPQRLAARRLIQNRAEVLDDMHVVQAEIRQRWQTKRGPVGNEHTVDWLSLDLGASYFPDRDRDNFGQSFGLLQYNFLWNVGDRLALSSSGWYEPVNYGTRYVNLGVFFSRPDGSNIYIGYRHTDPIGSRVFLTALGYQFSRKYSVSVTTAFDFSNNFSQSTTVAFNRTGTDVTMSLGLSYNAFQNNLGLQFLVIPNAALVGRRSQGIGNLFQFQ
jgi:hypothetical protein